MSEDTDPYRFPIDQAPQAYELITGKTGEPFLGVLLTYAADTPYNVNDVGANLKPAPIPSSSKNPEHPVLFPSHPPIPLPRLSLGVLGAGNFAGAVLLPAVRKLPGVELVGIASASGMSAQHAASRFGFSYAGSDEKRILDDEKINTVAILTRHHLHARQVMAALQAGKHVFCEKPLAINEADLQEIEAALAAPSHLLMVGFNRRFAPLAQQLKAFLKPVQEALFVQYRINAGYLPLNHWTQDPEQGGGRIIGEACHFVDFITFLVGAPPVAVSTHGLPDGGRYREDNVTLTFTFPNGSIGVVSYLANGDKAFPKERVEVFAAGRVAVLDDFRSLELVADGWRQVQRSRLRQDKGHYAEWVAFAAALRSGGPPPIPYEQLFGVTWATFAAVEALRTGKPLRIGR